MQNLIKIGPKYGACGAWKKIGTRDAPYNKKIKMARIENFFFQNYLQNLKLINITKKIRSVLKKPDFLAFFIDFGPIRVTPLTLDPLP